MSIPTTLIDSEVLTISDLNRCARELLEDQFGTLWVEGEISNLARPASGHCYFSLKDATAQVRCALFKGRGQHIKVPLSNGLKVRVLATVSLYEGRGDFQLIIETLMPAGDGALKQAFEALKKRLQVEGLFDEQHKQAIPELPRVIGVVTSATGAALRDILIVLRQRFASIPVIIYPTAVQGEHAAAEIVQALEQADQRQEVDVLILARGGGALEDLWPFNEEIVARAIHQSRIPIVSGVGHQTDFTIADFVADVRAPTPSAAASTCSPDGTAFLQQLAHLQQRLFNITRHHLQDWRHQLKYLKARLKHPKIRLQQSMQRLDYLNVRLNHIVPKYLQSAQQRLQRLTEVLAALSPLATLNRGYSITFKNERIIQAADALHPGDTLRVQFAQGQVSATVDKVSKG